MDNNVITIDQAKARHEEILNRVRTLTESKTVLASQIAKEISVSPATLSQILKGAYKADPSKVVAKIENWLRLREQKSTAPTANPGFVMTQTAKQITTDINFAHLVAEDGIVVIYGAPGVGKTQTLKNYKRNNNNVWMLFACPSRASLTAFLYELALEVGIVNPTKRKGDLSRAIRKRLMQSEGIIIVDEAQHLSYDTLEELRIIQEETNIPLVLSGNKRTYAKMTGGMRAEDFAQLFSRVAKKRGINKVKQADVRAIADAWNIQGESERRLMLQISERPGGLRLLSKTLKLATMYAEGEQISEKTLRAAFSELETNE